MQTIAMEYHCTLQVLFCILQSVISSTVEISQSQRIQRAKLKIKKGDEIHNRPATFPIRFNHLAAQSTYFLKMCHTSKLNNHHILRTKRLYEYDHN